MHKNCMSEKIRNLEIFNFWIYQQFHRKVNAINAMFRDLNEILSYDWKNERVTQLAIKIDIICIK